MAVKKKWKREKREEFAFSRSWCRLSILKSEGLPVF
jgi:hypothetical protein